MTSSQLHTVRILRDIHYGADAPSTTGAHLLAHYHLGRGEEMERPCTCRRPLALGVWVVRHVGRLRPRHRPRIRRKHRGCGGIRYREPSWTMVVLECETCGAVWDI